MSLTASDSIFDFKSYTSERRKRIEDCLDLYLTAQEPPQLWESMRYSVLSGGKRLRALLCLAAAEAVAPGSKTVERVLPAAAAIEMVHAMSLIHDDLPCLDNDDMRRGKPTNHKVFGEAVALLAGDALLIYANQILIERTPIDIDRSLLLDLSLMLSKALGADGMVGGQVDDMLLTGAGENFSDLSDSAPVADLIALMHKKKTGALIRFSVWSGARLAGATRDQLDQVSRLGEIIGLAFQIADDLLDVTGDAATIGKTPGKDEAAKKTTWVRVFGEAGARARLQDLEQEGKSAIASCAFSQSGSEALSALLHYSIHREN